MKNVLMIIPPVTEKIWTNHYHEIYLGLAYIARKLVDNGHLVEVIDADASYIPFLTLKNKIIRFSPDYVFLTSIYGSMNNAIKVASLVKEVSDATIVLGGVPATFAADIIMKNSLNIDIYAKGESEETAVEIVSGKKWSEIAGISYIENDSLIHNKKRFFSQSLDPLGIPLRSIFPLNRYRVGYEYRNSTTLETVRGCPYNCNFCVQTSMEGGTLRYRSTEMVKMELLAIKKDHPNIRRIMIIDNDFLINQEHAHRFLNMIIEEGLNRYFSFLFATRVETFIQGGEELLLLVKKANVIKVFFGIEAVSSKCKESIGKINNEDDIALLFKKMEDIDIFPLPSYIIGYPEETESDMMETVDFAKKLNTVFFCINMLTPYPGTPFYIESKNKSLLKHDDLNIYDNGHQVLHHKEDLEKILKRFYNRYVFSLSFYKKIKILEIYKSKYYGRVAILIRHILLLLLYSKIVRVKRMVKNRFLTASTWDV